MPDSDSLAGYLTYVTGIRFRLKNPQGDVGAGLGIGERVMMLRKVVPAGGGDGMELMIGQLTTEMAVGGRKRIDEAVIGVIHPIDAMNGLQAAFVEAGIVRDERQALEARRNLLPDLRKERRVVRVLCGQAVYLLANIQIIIRLWMNQAVKALHDFFVPDNDHTHAAHTGTALVGGLEINGCKIIHNALSFL